jgi:VCBS repeat protein
MTTERAVKHRLRIAIPIAVLAASGLSLSAAPPTFSTKQLVSPVINGLLPFDVRTEDIDQDGDLDITVAAYSGRISWFENDGAHPPGPWLEHVLTEFADGANTAVAARVDGDADIDFLSTAFNLDSIAWYENGGDGLSWSTRPLTFTARLAIDVCVADLDGDGDNDAISASGFDGEIAWYENPGVFDNYWGVRVIGAATSIEAADLDQDGDPDIVAGSVWFDSDGGSPPAFVTRPVAASPAYADAVTVMDVDRDGDPDILTAGQEDDRIVWYENDGSWPPGWTTRVVSTAADFATGVYGADLDGDADVDLLSSSFMDDTIAWYENDGGSPPSWTERAISTTAQGARSVYAADLDDDGDKDVLSASQSDGKVVLHLNDANYPDADRDGMRDALDCAPGNGTAFVVPREVGGVRFRPGARLEWNSAAAGSGSGARHDVVRGTLSPSSAGSRSAETCLANDTPARTLAEATVPAPGTGFYYFVRASNDCGTGTFGAGTSGAPRNIAACP